VLKERVSREHRVVRLNDSGGDLGRRIDGETKLGLLSVVNREALKEERAETGTSTTSDGVEDKEALETSAVISELADAVKGQVNNLLTDGVVTTGIVVGGIFLSGDELLGVEELAVGTSADLVNHSWLKIQKDGTGNVLSSSGLREKGVEGIITSSNGLVGGHLSIRLDSMLKAVELPAGISGLDTGLTNVN